MSGAPALVLVVEDEAHMARLLRASLGSHGLRVLQARRGSLAIELASSHNPDLILLDLGLPDMDGLEVAQAIRARSAIPILVLSARGQEEDKIRALDAGASDYITKPFGTEELLARVRVALRHAAQARRGQASVIEVGELRLDLIAREVTLRGEAVHLTPTEYKLLATLARRLDEVVTHRQLLTEVWGPTRAEETAYLRVTMGQLRHKIEREPSRPRYLLTEPRVGYRLRQAAPQPGAREGSAPQHEGDERGEDPTRGEGGPREESRGDQRERREREAPG